MTDRGYYNFYTPDEYESYQQFPPYNYGQTSEAKLEETMIKFMEMQQQQMQEMQDQNQQYLKNSLARAKNLENQLVQLAKQLANNNNQGETFQTNTQTTPDEKDNNPMKNEESGESVKGVENNEEERMRDECGEEKIVIEIETPHEVELPQELPCIEKTSTVDNEELMMGAEETKGLLDKEISIEQKREMENKAEIDRVIDEICITSFSWPEDSPHLLKRENSRSRGLKHAIYSDILLFQSLNSCFMFIANVD
ncbi:unnamed protein product [Trifolium pratense]|uniref:Uncharacterized protein n=1 Tax=Trifolium pratense TaxID=57577 RepID=A0ACB0KFD1_TRIPR|nr:unnamed protein product [Trifolium pratense]